MTEILKPEECTHLKKKLGNRFNKVVQSFYHEDTQDSNTSKKSTKGRKPKAIHNPFYWYFKYTPKEDWGEFIDGIIYGVCQLDHYGKGVGQELTLSQSRCKILLKEEHINTNTVMYKLSANKRQSQRYVKAMGLIVNHVEPCVLERLKKTENRFRRIIKEDCEKWNLPHAEEHIEDALESMFLLHYCPNGIEPSYSEDIEPVYKAFEGFKVVDRHRL